MTAPSILTTTLFVVLVGAVAALFGWAVARAAQSAHAGRGRPGAWLGLWLAVVLGWIAVPAMLAGAGLLNRYAPLPAPALVLVGGLALSTTALVWSPAGKRIATSVPLAALVGYQVFRAPLEWLLHRMWIEGALPVQMTYAGRNFDVISGLTAGALALYLTTGRRPVPLVLAWNIVGLILLANIVTIAVLSTPVSFRVFMNDPQTSS